MDTATLNGEMQEFTIRVPKQQTIFFEELMSRLHFTVLPSTEVVDNEALANVRQGLKEIGQIEKGTLAARPVQALLAELADEV
jgi:argininosuccinate lyase